jgi:plasmid replication initiation protein
MKTPDKINTDRYEVNKPSELCQVIFIKNFKNDFEIYKISPMQLDLINGIIYKVREIIIKENLNIDDEIPSTLFDIKLNDFANMFSAYTNNDYKVLLEKLIELSEMKIIINALGKNKDIDETIMTRFIHEIRLSKHKHQKNQRIRVAISNIIINRFINVKKYFSKMFFTIQFSMVSKYSKLLYELLKDYENIKKIELTVNSLHDLLNVVEPNQRKWTLFNQNILKKAVNEINEKADIKVFYEPIKERPSSTERLQVTKVKFVIEKQTESRLQSLGLIHESIKSNKFYNKSKNKLDKLLKTGYKLIDEEKWIETDIKNNAVRYDAEIRIDNWLKNTPQDDKNNIYAMLAKTLDDCDEQFIYIDGYLIRGVFSNDSYTRNPMETISVMNELINQISSNSTN